MHMNSKALHFEKEDRIRQRHLLPGEVKCMLWTILFTSNIVDKEFSPEVHPSILDKWNGLIIKLLGH